MSLGMKLRGSRSASNADNSRPLTSRRKKTLLLTTEDRRGRIHLPQVKLPLLLLLWGLQTSPGSTEVAIKVDLDLAPKSFDDQYQGCSRQVMEELNEGEYFNKELDAHKNYSRMWQKAHLGWLGQAKALPKNMTTAHAVAILMYTLNRDVRSDFSRAMASAARSPEQYKQAFHFKYLHYYLTSAIQLLRKENESLCHEVHHRLNDVHFEADVNTTIRFGQFLSASLLREEVQEFGNPMVVTIITCLGAPVHDFSLKKNVLIPPYELFEVVSKSYHPKGEWLYLRSAGNQSTYNCQLLTASSRKSIPDPLVIVLLSFLASVLISSKS